MIQNLNNKKSTKNHVTMAVTRTLHWEVNPSQGNYARHELRVLSFARRPRPWRATHLGVTDGYEREGQQVSENEGAHDVDLPLVVRPDLPAVGVVVIALNDALVVRHGGRHDQ